MRGDELGSHYKDALYKDFWQIVAFPCVATGRKMSLGFKAGPGHKVSILTPTSPPDDSRPLGQVKITRGRRLTPVLL